MNFKNIEKLNNMKEDSLEDLDVVLLGALELYIRDGLSSIKFPDFKNPLVGASVNALTTAKILLGSNANYCDENDFKDIIESKKDKCDGAIVFSASGGKHAPILAKAFVVAGLDTYLVTCTKNSEAQEVVGAKKTIVTPKNPEPYTYNTSTYLGWVLQKTGEDPKEIYEFIKNEVEPFINEAVSKHRGYYVLIPDFGSEVGRLFNVKFEELFGTEVSWQIHTFETSRHAKTVVPPQFTIVFGKGNWPVHISYEKSYEVPLPKGAKEGALMAIGYYFFGRLQKMKEPYFKKYIKSYVEENKKRGEFASSINVIVK